MKAIVNGKIILPDSIVEGRALLFDEKIAGLRRAAMSRPAWWTSTSTAIWARTPPTAA